MPVPRDLDYDAYSFLCTISESRREAFVSRTFSAILRAPKEHDGDHRGVKGAARVRHRDRMRDGARERRNSSSSCWAFMEKRR